MVKDGSSSDFEVEAGEDYMVQRAQLLGRTAFVHGTHPEALERVRVLGIHDGPTDDPAVAYVFSYDRGRYCYVELDRFVEEVPENGTGDANCVPCIPMNP